MQTFKFVSDSSDRSSIFLPFSSFSPPIERVSDDRRTSRSTIFFSMVNRVGRSIVSSSRFSSIIFDSVPSTRTAATRSTTTPRQRFNASCDFDVDKELCGWKSDTKYGWKVINQRESNITIGPTSDYSSISKFRNSVRDDRKPLFVQNGRITTENSVKFRSMRKARSTTAFCKIRTCSAREVITSISPVGMVSRFYFFFFWSK